MGMAAITISSLNLHCGLSGTGRPYDVPEALASLDADVIAIQEAWWTTGGADGATVIGAAANGAATDGPATGDLTAANAATDRTAPDRAKPDRAKPDRAVVDRAATDSVATAADKLGAQLIRTQVAGGASLAELGIARRPDRGSWGIAVLSRLPVTRFECLSLGRAPGDSVSRSALICSVTTPGGWPLRLVNTHLTHRLTSPAQLYKLTQYLASDGDPVPTVIVGDLNMPRLATWIAAGYAPTVRGRTFPAYRPVIQLDHLLASPRLDIAGAEVLGPLGSDHLPIRARVGPA
jgi:endonuclease/exonuclease/phosphatase family metal-dependent hydrolase